MGGQCLKSRDYSSRLSRLNFFTFLKHRAKITLNERIELVRTIMEGKGMIIFHRMA